MRSSTVTFEHGGAVVELDPDDCWRLSDKEGRPISSGMGPWGLIDVMVCAADALGELRPDA
jgi:hypothetical protein